MSKILGYSILVVGGLILGLAIGFANIAFDHYPLYATLASLVVVFVLFVGKVSNKFRWRHTKAQNRKVGQIVKSQSRGRLTAVRSA